MTAPVSHDYPDWGRRQSRADSIYVAQSYGPTAVQQFTPIFFVGDVDYINIGVSGLVNSWVITASFWDSPAKNVPLQQFEINIRQGDVGSVSIPVLGPYLQFDMVPSLAASSITLIINSVPSMSMSSALGAGGTVLGFGNPQGVNAGVTATVDCTVVIAGPASFVAWSDGGAAFRAEVLAVDYLNNARLLAVCQNAQGGMPMNIWLPASHIRVTLFNGDGAAHNIYWSLHVPWSTW